MTKKDIAHLFKQRDKGINEGKPKLFLDTMVEEIRMFNATGYLTSNKMETDVIAISPDGPSLTKVVFAKETYFEKDKKTHHAYLMFYVVATSKGWKIYNIIY